MLRKFKHKKTGRFAYESNPKGVYYIDNNPCNQMLAVFIEDSNDWEEIKPEYTILSKGINVYNQETIYSVRRESDGEVFTVGDKFLDAAGQEHVIDSFDVHLNIGVRAIPKGVTWVPAFASIKKVKSKEWEITAFIDDRKRIFTDCKEEWSLKRYLADTECEIYSVKRLSDGVEFKIGDKIKWKWLAATHNYFTIKEIIAYSNGFGSRFNEISAEFSFDNLNKAELKKVEKLFTTEDGVDIYVGDNFFQVNLEPVFLILHSGNSYKFTAGKETPIKDRTSKSFSTKEKAEEWIKANRKVLFVTKDNVKIYHGDGYYCINTSLWTHWFQKAGPNTQLHRDVIAFKDADLAREYIFENTPCISLAELAKIYVTAKRSTNSEYNKQYRNKLEAIVKSKLKK